MRLERPQRLPGVADDQGCLMALQPLRYFGLCRGSFVTELLITKLVVGLLKDIEAVVEVSHNTGIGKKVAKLSPILVVIG